MNAIIKGLIVGTVATGALDRLSTYLYDHEEAASRKAEDQARSGLHAYEKAVAGLGRAVGVRLKRKDLGVWGWRFHKAFGIAGGLAYVLFRKRYPKLGALSGLVFGNAAYGVAAESTARTLERFSKDRRAA